MTQKYKLNVSKLPNEESALAYSNNNAFKAIKFAIAFFSKLPSDTSFLIVVIKGLIASFICRKNIFSMKKNNI